MSDEIVTVEKDNKKKKKKHSNLKRLIAFTCIFFVLFFIVSDVMTVSDCTSLANVRGFYMEPENSLDVALIGPSEFYADYSATQAWKEYGYTSYSLAVAGVPGNLYKSMLKEVQKRQSPKLVVFEINGFIQGDKYFNRQGQMHSWLDNIPWSENKLETIKEVVPKEDQYSYFCKIATYHDNWKKLSDCANCMAVKAHMDLNGYSYTKGFGTYTKCSDDIEKNKEKKVKYTNLAQDYLTDLLQYCKDSGLENVLFVRFPHGRKIENPEVMDQLQNLITAYGYDFVNLNDNYEELGIDPKTDFYNAEHLNVEGMQKMTHYFGNYLCSNYDIKGDHSQEQVAYWNDCARKTEDVIQECQNDLKDGVVRRYFELSVYLKPKRIKGKGV